MMETNSRIKLASYAIVAVCFIGLGEPAFAYFPPTATPTPTCGAPPMPTLRPTPTRQPTVGFEPPVCSQAFPFTYWANAHYPIGFTYDEVEEEWKDQTDEITYPNPYPTPGSVFGPCQEIEFHCVRAVDVDRRTAFQPSPCDYTTDYVYDAMAPLTAGYPYWKCAVGSFIETREGEDVKWKSPKTAQWVNVSVYDNDWPTPIPEPPPGDEYPYDVMGSRDDPERQVDWVSFVVADVDLKIDDSPTLEQKDIFVNCDDDNLDGDVDKDEPTSTTNLQEDDLPKVSLTIAPYNLDSGIVTLNVQGSSRIILWVPSGNEKKGSILTDFYWDLGASQNPPSTLRVEGFQASASENDVKLELRLYHGGELIDKDRVEFTVFDIEEVEWAAVYKPLDLNPGVGAGRRIFASLDQPTPPPEPTVPDWENLVRVRAQISPALSGRNVYFKCYDVDDPSSSNPVIDDENDTKDNYGTPKTGKLRPANELDPQHIVDHTASVGGWAELDFIVTGRPGDNYRIAACLPPDKDFFGHIEAKQDVSDGKIVMKHGTRGDVAASYRTEMLTVWRNLWVEFDRMGPPPENEQFGTVQEFSQAVTEGGRKLVAQGDPSWTLACLNGGVLNPRGTTAPNSVNLFPPGTSFWEVHSNTSNAVEVRWNLRVDPNDPNKPDGFDQDGDGQVDEDGEYHFLPTSGIAPDDFAVNTDDLSWHSFAPGETPPPGDVTTHPEYDAVIDSLNGYLQPAYVRAQMLPIAVDVAPFQRHGGHPDPPLIDCYGYPWYWIARVFFAYDSFYRKETYPGSTCPGGVVYWGDDDPEDEALEDRDWKISSLGHTDQDRESCLINCETIRDHPPRDVMETIAHEVGHALGLNHAKYVDGEGWDPDREGVMGWEPKAANPPQFPCVRDWLQIIRVHSYPLDRYSNYDIANIRANTTD